MSSPKLIGQPTIEQHGQSVVMTALCECAVPAPTVTWCMDDTEVKEGEDYAMSLEPETEEGKYKAVCTITKFDKKLSGVYKGTLKNEHGEVSATFTLTQGDAPEMIEKPKIEQTEDNNTLIIKLRAKSKLDATASWSKDEKPLEESDRVKIVSTKDTDEEYTFQVEVKEPVAEDQGKYMCVVKNAEGTNSQALNLQFG